MLVSLLLALSLAMQGAPAKTGILTGELAPVSGKAVSRPMKVVLMPGDFGTVYDGEVLRLLDENWERFKLRPDYAQQKELFPLLSQLAQKEAIEFVLTVMSQNGANVGRLTRDTSSDGRFEFKDIPQGEYKIVAYGEMGAPTTVVWQGWVNLDAAGPTPVTLKSTLP